MKYHFAATSYIFQYNLKEFWVYPMEAEFVSVGDRIWVDFDYEIDEPSPRNWTTKVRKIWWSREFQAICFRTGRFFYRRTTVALEGDRVYVAVSKDSRGSVLRTRELHAWRKYFAGTKVIC